MKKLILFLSILLIPIVAHASLIGEQNNKNSLSYYNQQIISMNKQAYSVILHQVTTGFNYVWNNPDGYTPQQVIGTFSGADQSGLFALSYQLQQILQGVNPSYVILSPTPNYSIVPNQDGTVTITNLLANNGNVNWDEVASLLGSGVNWSSVKSWATGVNWSAISQTMGVNWASVNLKGVNWANWPNAEAQDVNWATFVG